MTDKVKTIFIVFNSLEIGGIERKIIDLSHYYSRKSNIQLYILLKLHRGDFLNQIPNNIHIKTMTTSTGYVKNFIFPFWLWLQLYRYHPSLTLAFGNFASICTIIASRFFIKTKVVISEDSSIDKQIYSDSFPVIREVLVRITYPLADGIIALTPTAKQKLSSLAPLQKITILPNWLPITVPKVATPKTHIIDILFIGRFETQKNPLMFLSICKEIQKTKPLTKIAMVGQGRLLPQIKAYINKNHLKIDILPATTPIQQLYPNAKVMVLTSIHEGFPLTILESFYYRCPVIAPNLKELSSFFKLDSKKFLYNNRTEAIKLIIQATCKPLLLKQASQQYRDNIISARNKNFHDTLDYLQKFL